MLYLAPHIHVAPVRDRAVILDLLRDKYLALSTDLSRALFSLIGQMPAGFSSSQVAPETLERTAKQLLEKGILRKEPPAEAKTAAWSNGIRPSSTRWPSTRWETSARTRLSASAFLGVMGTLSEVSIALRTMPFHGFVARISREPVAMQAVAIKSEQAVLDEFFFARPWFPVEPICRLDAPALCLHLRRQGHPAQLIFGVTLEKFSAHCWVQIGDRVLKEPHESISGYSPILIV